MFFEFVKEFNTTFEVQMRHPQESSVRLRSTKLRFGLIREEFGELLDAIDLVDLVEVADALGDIAYVALGAALVFGIHEEVEDNLHEATTTADGIGEKYGWLLSTKGQELVLRDLRWALLINNKDNVIVILSDILQSVAEVAKAFDMDLAATVAAIHESNMTKLGPEGLPIFREGDNKVMKGPDYKTPTEDIETALFEC